MQTTQRNKRREDYARTDEADQGTVPSRRTKQSGRKGESAADDEIIRAHCQIKHVAHYADPAVVAEKENVSERPIHDQSDEYSSEDEATIVASGRPNNNRHYETRHEADDPLSSACQHTDQNGDVPAETDEANSRSGLPNNGRCVVERDCETETVPDSTCHRTDQGGDEGVEADRTHPRSGRKKRRCAGASHAVTEAELADICERLQKAQRNRRHFMKSRIGIENRLRSSIAVALGFVMNDEDSRKKAFKKSTAIIKQIAKGNIHKGVSETMLKLAQTSLLAIKGFNVAIKSIESDMKKLAKQLPVASWVKNPDQRGFGILSLAIIVGECGNLSNYPKPGKLWRRMGCIPFTSQGKTQMGSAWRKQKGLTKKEWDDYKYCPRRRSVAYMIGINFLRTKVEVDGETDLDSDCEDGGEQGNVTDRPLGPYLRRYAEVKAAKLAANSEEWPPGRCHKHAMLLASKLLLLNLWIAWTQSGHNQAK